MVNVAERILFLFPTSRPFHDWQVEQVSPTEQRIARWNTAIGAQPTEAELAAVTPVQIAAVPEQQATIFAQEEKAAATQGVDDSLAKHGNRIERIVIAVATSALDAINNDRAAITAMNTAVQAATSLADLKTRFAAITFPPQVTVQQLQNVIKSKIAATPE